MDSRTRTQVVRALPLMPGAVLMSGTARAEMSAEELARLAQNSVGKLPVNTQLSAYYNVVKPDFGANWQIRAQVQLMFAK